MIIQAQKIPLSYSDQVTKLESKGLLIPDKAYAEAFLSTVNYYRLRGYYIHLHDSMTDKFHPGTNFNKIVDIYEFDNELRHLLGQQISRIEVNMRTKIAYSIAHEYGGLGYLCVNNFEVRKFYYEFITTALNEVKRSDDIHIKHFEKNYDGQIPIWSLVELLSMTALSKLLSNLKPDELRSIMREYNLKVIEMVKSNFYAISLLRNKCAHGNRIYNRKIITKPRLHRADSDCLIDNQPDSLYAMLFAMKYLSLNKQHWNNFIDKLETLTIKYSTSIDISLLGMPKAWKTPLIKI